jgi:hypothetical protein
MVEVLWYEVSFGLIIIAGLGMMKEEVNYLNGMFVCFSSIILGLFHLMNALIRNHITVTFL